MDVGRRGRLYALDLELVAHLLFVHLDIGLTPAVGVTRARHLFLARQRCLEGGASFAGHHGDGRHQHDRQDERCQQGQSPHRSLRPLVGDPLHSPHTTHTPFVRTGESYGSTFPANFVEEPLQYHLALPAQRSRFWVTFASLFEQIRNLLAPQYTRRAVSSRSSRTSDAVGRLQLVEKGTCREITKPASALAWSPLPHSQQLLRAPPPGVLPTKAQRSPSASLQRSAGGKPSGRTPAARCRAARWPPGGGQHSPAAGGREDRHGR